MVQAIAIPDTDTEGILQYFCVVILEVLSVLWVGVGVGMLPHKVCCWVILPFQNILFLYCIRK